MTTKNTVQLNVNLSLYTIALRAAAIAMVVTPVHEKKKTDEIIRIKAFQNWYLYACFSSLTHMLNMMKIPAIREITLPMTKFHAKSILINLIYN
jgi:hypothetical protein